MVLYKRKPIVLPPPKTLPSNLNCQVWHINETGEWFTTYSEYLDRLDFYTRHYFTCEITGTSCLTFFEALNSEETQFKFVEEKFPLKLREPVARFLHFNDIRRIDLLVEQVYSKFKCDFFPGEIVFLRKLAGNQTGSSTPVPDDLFKDENNAQQQQQPQYQKPYAIKEKAHFNAIVSPNTGEEISPAYSKYMLAEEQGSGSIIADQSQIYRDRSTFTKHLIKCFCKITLRRASSKMGAPWCVKEEYLQMYGLTMDWPLEMLKYKEDYLEPSTSTTTDSKKRPTAVTPATENTTPEPKKQKISEEPAPIPDAPQQITSIVEDLKLPYTGQPISWTGIFQYTDSLEHIPVGFQNIKPFQNMTKLLQVYQFLNTFNEKLYISNFTLDDFITSIKCADPQEITGESVTVELINTSRKPMPSVKDEEENIENNNTIVEDIKLDDSDQEQEEGNEEDNEGENEEVKNEKKEDSMPLERDVTTWTRNPEVREFIENRNSDLIRYTISKNGLAGDDQIDAASSSGSALIIECFVSLLRLFIDENGSWNCLVMENWFDDSDVQTKEEKMDEDGMKGSGDESEQGSKQDENKAIKRESKSKSKEKLPREEEGITNPEIDTLLEKCLNFRNVNWSERLSKRQFHNGYWLITLLGVFQDCMHLPMYTKFIHKFIKAVVPNEGKGTQLNKLLWRNFCRNLSLNEKVTCLWILVDLVSNFSQDIKTSMEDSMELCGQIRSERFKAMRDLKTESLTLQEFANELKSAEAENADPDVIGSLKEKVAGQEGRVRQLQADKNYLEWKLFENDMQRLKILGLDKYGNKYYWLELSGLPRPGPQEEQTVEDGNNQMDDKEEQDVSYESGRLWIQGPSELDAQFFLKISPEDLQKWKSIAEVKNPVKATHEVFHIYRDADGSYKHEEGGSVTTLVDSTGAVNSLIALSPIQRKIIDETPELLMLSESQWYSVERVEDVENLISRLDTWGRREHALLRQLKNVEDEVKESLKRRENVLSLYKRTEGEQELIKDLEENEFTEAELNLELENNGRGEDEEFREDEELENIAEEIMKLDDSSKTRKVLNKIKQLEQLRDELLQKKQAFEDSHKPGARVQLRAERKRTRVSCERKLKNQERILSRLLNQRQTERVERCSSWKNALSNELWGTSLTKGASGEPKIDVSKTIELKMAQILNHTSRGSTGTFLD